jgi:hypothetical protein
MTLYGISSVNARAYAAALPDINQVIVPNFSYMSSWQLNAQNQLGVALRCGGHRSSTAWGNTERAFWGLQVQIATIKSYTQINSCPAETMFWSSSIFSYLF